jgi:hypothetical protein
MLSTGGFEVTGQAVLTMAGSIVTRSLSPFPLRTTSWLAPKSMS